MHAAYTGGSILVATYITLHQASSLPQASYLPRVVQVSTRADSDESRWSRWHRCRLRWVTAGKLCRLSWVSAGTCWVPVPRLQADLVHPLRAGTAYGVPLLARNQMRDPEQRRRAPQRAPRRSGHRPVTSYSHISARYAWDICVCEYRPINAYCYVLLRITTYYWPTKKLMCSVRTEHIRFLV